MGKSLSTMYGAHESNGFTSEISRHDLIEAVDIAIEAVHGRHGHGPELAVIDTARAFAQNTDKVDALTWKCKNSCGCPMTAVGAVTFKQEGARANDDPRHSAPGMFASVFDSEIEKRTGADDSVTLTVVD